MSTNSHHTCLNSTHVTETPWAPLMCVTPSSSLTQVRLQEMRESLRIVYQCINEMPNGLFKSADHKVGRAGGGASWCSALCNDPQKSGLRVSVHACRDKSPLCRSRMKKCKSKDSHMAPTRLSGHPSQSVAHEAEHGEPHPPLQALHRGLPRPGRRDLPSRRGAQGGVWRLPRQQVCDDERKSTRRGLSVL